MLKRKNNRKSSVGNDVNCTLFHLAFLEPFFLWSEEHIVEQQHKKCCEFLDEVNFFLDVGLHFVFLFKLQSVSLFL